MPEAEFIPEKFRDFPQGSQGLDGLQGVGVEIFLGMAFASEMIKGLMDLSGISFPTQSFQFNPLTGFGLRILKDLYRLGCAGTLEGIDSHHLDLPALNFSLIFELV